MLMFNKQAICIATTHMRFLMLWNNEEILKKSSFIVRSLSPLYERKRVKFDGEKKLLKNFCKNIQPFAVI